VCLSNSKFQMFFIKGVNTIKGTMCGKVKMIFQGLHVAYWFVLPNFAFLTPNLQLYASSKNHLLHLILNHTYYASMLFITLKWITFVKNMSFKFMIFKTKNTFEPKTFKCVVNMNITNFNSFCSLNHQY